MLLIGLTGSFGTGKSTVAAMFKAKGAKVIDADTVTRDLLLKNTKCIKKVAKSFPGAIICAGDIDRSKLAKVVFQHPRELKKLTDILYPEALKEVKRQISLYRRTQFIVLDVPLLFETGWDRLADITVVVRASRKEQVQRIQNRMGISRSEILKRLKFQMPQKEKCRLADIIIDNNGPLQETRTQVSAVFNRFRKIKK